MQEAACKFIDLHLNQMSDNLMIRYITERWVVEGKPLKTAAVPGSRYENKILFFKGGHTHTSELR